MRRLSTLLLASLVLPCALSARVRTTDCSLFLRSDSLQVTQIPSKEAVMYNKVGHHGPAVENRYCAIRLYFNDSGALDIYSKSGESALELRRYLWYPTASEQRGQGAGCDEYLVGNTVGPGGIALWDGEKKVKLKATGGRTARVGKNRRGAWAEMISYGVPYKGDKVDISVRVEVSEKSRTAVVTARELNGREVQFLSGVNFHPGQTIRYGRGFIAVWGVHPSDVSKSPVPVGAGMWYDPELFPSCLQEADFIRIVSVPTTSVSTEITAASEKEEALGNAGAFIEYISSGHR